MSKSIKLYRVKEDYVNYLRSFCNTVRFNNNHHVETYVGILLEIEERKYVAPITHIMKENKINQIPIIVKKEDGTIENKLGTILLHNMIPVYDSIDDKIYELVEFDFLKNSDNIKDRQEYSKLLEQYKWINIDKNKSQILRKSKNVYDITFNEDHPDHDFLCNILKCNFSLLEEAMDQYKKTKKATIN